MNLEQSVSTMSSLDSQLSIVPWAEGVEDYELIFPSILGQYEDSRNDNLSLNFEENVPSESSTPLLVGDMVRSDSLLFQSIETVKGFVQAPGILTEGWYSAFSSEPPIPGLPETSAPGPAGTAGRVQSVQPSNIFSLVYQGIANIAYAVVDPLTNAITNIFRKTTQVSSVIASPQAAAGIVESNPFSLSINSSTQNLEGDFSIFSALPFDGFLAQYWQLQYDPNTNQFAGELTNSNVSTALAVNGMIVNEPLPGFPSMTIPSNATMRTGARMAGIVTDDQMQVQIAGSAFGLVASNFLFEITANLERTA